MENDPYPRRKMKQFWRWHEAFFIAAGIGSMALDFWLDWKWIWLLPFIVGAFLLLHMYKFVRCPKCARRLKVRKVEETQYGKGERYLYDCPNCKITWDSGFIPDNSSG